MSDIQVHIRSTHSETFIECKNCNIPVVNEIDDNSCEKQTTENQTFQCVFCDFSSQHLINLQHHIVDSHTRDPNHETKTSNRRATMETQHGNSSENSIHK